MPATAIIPARYGSTRFPGKPLAQETGKYLVQHVYERVARCTAIDRVVVATDDDRIVAAVRSFGGEALMTQADHVSGTDRVAEAARMLDLADDDLVLNVQGDEPELAPGDLDRLIAELTGADRSCRIATLAVPFADDAPREGPGSPLDPNCVKVVVDDQRRALYFSRSPIPYPRQTAGRVDCPSQFLLHLGVYAFRADTLWAVTETGGLARGRLEIAESLEQLRWLEHGLPILVTMAEHRVVGIDTPHDYAAFVKRSRLGDREVTKLSIGD
ncbi:MAG: 3-deoxy-manno-octulosonate cytidylyltransferase [Planctomycetes bacterium]|nr:3-deoxy-manno-octulosonate cytidylyltransferase [Planctomycetota bacterium]